MRIKHFLLAALSAAILLTGCKKNEDSPTVGGMTFTASIAPFQDATTKTTIFSDGKLTWNSNDTISVNGVPFVASSLSGDSTSAVFVKAGSAADPVAPFVAYYPYTICASPDAVPTLPLTQKWDEENNLSSINPMYAESASEQALEFTNICGLIEFRLKAKKDQREGINTIKMHAGNGSFSGPFSLAKETDGYRAVINDGNPIVSLDMGDGVIFSDTAQSFCVAVPAERYSNMTVQFIGGFGTSKSYFIDSADVTILKGMRYVVNMELDLDAFESAEDAFNALDGCYAMIYGSEYCPDWPLKAATLIGNGPTLDMQFTGEDAAFNTQSVKPDNEFLRQAWFHCYKAINLCNGFISAIGDTKPSEKITQGQITELTAEARALRGFFHSWLAQTFGQVPILGVTEVFTDNTGKSKPETYESMWDEIISDFTYSSENLSWYPDNDEYGRVTKGMALTYLADAYMWKAYRVPDAGYSDAQSALKEVIESGTYQLSPGFTTLWDPGAVENRKIEEYILFSEFDPNGCAYPTTKSYRFANDICSQVSYLNDGNLSWEWYSAYETDDKRRDGSCCTDKVANMGSPYPERSDYVYGINPFVKVNMPGTTFHYTNGSTQLPSVWNMKLWKSASGFDGRMVTVPFIWKRYANVLLDYAECCFRTNDETTGWEYVDKIRARAFGNLEVGKSANLTSRFNKYYEWYYGAESGEYPIPFAGDVSKDVTPAKEYYATIHSRYSVELWQLALNMERRKEFAGEWSLFPDMVRSGFMADQINVNYDVTELPASETYENYPWTVRKFTFDANKLVMPIPQYELEHNELMEQNPGY